MQINPLLLSEEQKQLMAATQSSPVGSAVTPAPVVTQQQAAAVQPVTTNNPVAQYTKPLEFAPPKNIREGISNALRGLVLTPIQEALLLKERPEAYARRIDANYKMAQLADLERQQERRGRLITQLSSGLSEGNQRALQNLSLAKLEDLAAKQTRVINPYTSPAMSGVIANQNVFTNEITMAVQPTDRQKNVAAAGGEAKFAAIEAAGVSATENAKLIAQRKEIQPLAYENYLASLFTNATEAGAAARSQLNQVNLMADLLKQGAATGFGEATKNELRSVFASLGFEVDAEALARGEGFNAFSNRLALAVRNPAGGAGMPGSMSDSDRNFLVSTVPGLARSESGNALLIAVMQKQLERKIEVSRMAVKYYNEKQTMQGFEQRIAEYAEANPMFDEIQKQADALLQANQQAQSVQPDFTKNQPQPAGDS